MKVIITVIVLVVIAVMFIFTMAIARAAAPQTDLEQMLEDVDQLEFLRAWHEQKCGPDNVPDISADRIVHTVEPAEK